MINTGISCLIKTDIMKMHVMGFLYFFDVLDFFTFFKNLVFLKNNSAEPMESHQWEVRPLPCGPA